MIHTCMSDQILWNGWACVIMRVRSVGACEERSYLAETSVKWTKDEMTTPILPFPPWWLRERSCITDTHTTQLLPGQTCGLVIIRLSQILTLQWMTTTCSGSAFNQFSMALQMVQILSRGGAWKSGHPVSRVWGDQHINTGQIHSDIYCDFNGKKTVKMLQ